MPQADVPTDYTLGAWKRLLRDTRWLPIEDDALIHVGRLIVARVRTTHLAERGEREMEFTVLMSPGGSYVTLQDEDVDALRSALCERNALAPLPSPETPRA